MQLGLALPQYDFSVPGLDRLDWPTLRTWAVSAEDAGFDSLWLSDHIVWAIDRYGAAPGNHEGFEPLTTLAALARVTRTATLGTLVLATPIRPASILTKALTTIDRLSHGRLVVGLGAGWFEPDYQLTGQTMPTPGERLRLLSEAVDVVKATFANDAARGAPPNQPPPVQQPHPPIWLGGKGPRLVRLAATKADGWNYCWQATPAEYRPKLEAALDAAPDPDRFHPSLGIYTLVGETEADLRRRFDRLKATSPPGVIGADTTLDEYRQGRLVGTVEQVTEQVAAWKEAGVRTLIACLGSVPFSVTHLDDLQAVASAVQPVR